MLAAIDYRLSIPIKTFRAVKALDSRSSETGGGKKASPIEDQIINRRLNPIHMMIPIGIQTLKLATHSFPQNLMLQLIHRSFFSFFPLLGFLLLVHVALTTALRQITLN